MGYRVLPVTIVGGERAVVGYNVAALNEALGIREEGPRDLTAPELLEKFQLLYEAAKRAVRQLNDDQLDWVTPQNERRGQTLRQLAYHLFDRPDVCMEAAKSGHYTYDMCHEYERDAHTYRTTQSLLEYADMIVARLQDFLTRRPDPTTQVVETYFGPATVGRLLNMAIAGLALRIKQMYYFQRAIGIAPENPFTDADFEGIQVPRKIFG